MATKQNWPQWEKHATYLVICWFTFLAFMNSSAFTVAVVPIVKQFGKTATQASYLSKFFSGLLKDCRWADKMTKRLFKFSGWVLVP